MLDNLQVLNAILYVAKQGCKWRGLPKRFAKGFRRIFSRFEKLAVMIVAFITFAFIVEGLRLC